MPATNPASPSPALPVPAVRTIGVDDLRWALSEGLKDLLAMRGDLVFAALFYPLLVVIGALLALNKGLLPLVFPILAGIALLGPVSAIGFYELARRREAGLESGFVHYWDFVRRPAADAILVVAALLVSIFFVWLGAAALIYLGMVDEWGAPSIGQFANLLLNTPAGWALIVIGNLVGALFAVLVLAASIVSLPMLVDHNVGARTALATSFAAFRANPRVLIGWGTIIAALLVVGSIPLFIGLAAVLPWLGYATWHLYTRLVDRDAIPNEARVG